MIQAQYLKSLDKGEEDEDDEAGELMNLTEISLSSQRISTNAYALIMLIAYLIIGLLFYCFYGTMSAMDSIYLSIITLTTVGYGDIPVPNRTFQSFYVLLGVGMVGIYFSMFTNDVMEAQEELMTSKLVETAMALNKAVESRAQMLRDMSNQQHRAFLERIAATPPEELTALDRIQIPLSKLFLEQEASSDMRKMKAISLQVYEEELREIRSKGLVDLLFVAVSLLSGAVCMSLIEDWPFDDSFYWACVTAMTVGYGDVTPDTTSGKVFTIFYVIFSTALAAKGFRDVVCYPMIVKKKENEAFLLSQFSEDLTARTLQKVLRNNLFSEVDKLQFDAERITKAEFTLLVLYNMNKIAMKDILLATKCFDNLDVHREGALGKKEQEEQIQLAKARDHERRLEQRREAEAARTRASSTSTSSGSMTSKPAGTGLGRVFRSASEAVQMIQETVTSAVTPSPVRKSFYSSMEAGGDAENPLHSHHSPEDVRRGSWNRESSTGSASRGHSREPSIHVPAPVSSPSHHPASIKEEEQEDEEDHL